MKFETPECPLCEHWFSFAMDPIQIKFSCALCGKKIENECIPASVYRVASRLNAFLLTQSPNGRSAQNVATIYPFSDGSFDVTVCQKIHYFKSFANVDAACEDVGTIFSRVKISLKGTTLEN